MTNQVTDETISCEECGANVRAKDEIWQSGERLLCKACYDITETENVAQLLNQAVENGYDLRQQTAFDIAMDLGSYAPDYEGREDLVPLVQAWLDSEPVLVTPGSEVF